jgi:putative ABC transport system permease protein
MTQLAFYLRYAFRNLRRSGRWTIFAIFCIAAGVATVVALRSLGLAIADSLVDNVRATNHGDITISRGSGGSGVFSFNPERVTGEDDVFGDEEIERVRNWADERGGQMSAYITYGNLQITSVDAVTVGRPQFVSTFLIDPATFPPTGDIVALDPAGVPLHDLFTGGNDVVISQNLADAQNMQVGDTVRVSGTEEPYTVRGIVATENEANVRNLFASFFGFAYLDIAQAEKLQVPPGPNAMSVTLPSGTDLETAERDLFTLVGRRSRFTTVTELLEQNSVIGDYLGRFIVIMGLGALLIGGVGIINTMLVMVGRRTSEIAALKTFGLKGRQVAAIFMAEAFLLGIAGSVVGCVLGLLLGGVVNSYGETFLLQKLSWRIHPEAIAYGLGLGMIVTMVFGILPVLTANKVRPAIILRPNETYVPAAGCLQSLIAMLAVVVVIGGVAGRILGVLWVGIVGVAVTLLIMAILIGILWVIVWIVSRFPAFGWVDLRLALRNLTARRLRTATTLLALSAGMFALSSITFVGAGMREVLQFQLTQTMGGNVLVFPYTNLISQELGQSLLRGQLANVEGIERTSVRAYYNLDLLKVNGEEAEVTLPFGLDEADLPPQARRQLDHPTMTVTVEDASAPNPNQHIMEGRALTPEDRGQHVLLMTPNKVLANMGVGVGSVLTLEVGREQVDFTVVGILGTDSGNFFGGQSNSFVPPESLGSVRPDFTLNVLQVDNAHLNQALLDLSALVPPVFALDITFIDGLLSRLIQQFSAIPTVVGLLSLLAAAVIMANTVSLATLERRRQIGVLKAIGLKGWRVLLVMLLENTLVGLLGGLLGVGISGLAVGIMTAIGQGEMVPIPKDAVPTAIALIVASVIIAWIATFASSRVAINEQVTNVLRYE